MDSERLWKPLNDCQYGRYQSPIHIKNHYFQQELLPALEFINYHNYLSAPLTLTNNGHTVILKSNDELAPLDKRPYVTGSVLSSKYVFESLHFHWGAENNNGSEHWLNYVSFPMEMHIVHRNVLYNSTDEAIRHKDGLVVLGILFDVRLVGDNHRYKTIVNNLKQVAAPQSTYELQRLFPLSALLPKNLDVYFVYEGSLTTAPCSEAVIWFVFPDTVPISDRQMQYFRQLPIEANFREPQEIGQRKIILRQFSKTLPLSPPTPQSYSKRAFWLY